MPSTQLCSIFIIYWIKLTNYQNAPPRWSPLSRPLSPLCEIFFGPKKVCRLDGYPPFRTSRKKNHCQRILDLENTVLGPFLTSFSRVRLLLKVFDTLPLSSSRHLVSSRCGGGGKANGKLTRVHLSAGVLSGRHAHLIPYHLLLTDNAIHINLISAFSLLQSVLLLVDLHDYWSSTKQNRLYKDERRKHTFSVPSVITAQSF